MSDRAAAADGPLVVDVRDVEVRFGAVVALPTTTLRARRGESVALVGPSGSGKTTLLDCVAGLARPTAGEVWVWGERVDTLSTSRRSDLRRTGFGLVSQGPDLLPELSVAENVALTLLFDGLPRAAALEAAHAMLAELGLPDAGGRRPQELSGGEQQRVAVARALVLSGPGGAESRIVVADEPTASLDRANADLVMDALLGLAGRRGATLLVATHDLAVAGRCDRVVELRAGALVP